MMNNKVGFEVQNSPFKNLNQHSLSHPLCLSKIKINPRPIKSSLSSVMELMKAIKCDIFTYI